MRVYPVATPAEEIVRWVKEEARSGALDFYENAWKEYRIEEEYDRSKYHPDTPKEYDLVAVIAGLDVESRVERNYWILQIRVRHVLGLVHPREEDAYVDDEDLSLDDFEKDFIAPGKGEVTVRLLAETRMAKEHFDGWFARLEAKHKH